MNNNFPTRKLAAKVAATVTTANDDTGSADGKDGSISAGSANAVSLDGLKQHLDVTGLLRHVSGLQQRLMELDTEIGTVRSTTKSTGTRLVAQIEDAKEQLRALDVQLEGVVKSLVPIREDVAMQHKASQSNQRSMTVLASELEVLNASMEISKLTLQQCNRKFDSLAVAVDGISKRHFSILTLAVALIVGSVSIAMVIMGVGRLSKVPNAERLDVIEQYVIQHQQQLERFP